MKLILPVLMGIMVIACGKQGRNSSIELIAENPVQDSLFQKLKMITGTYIPENVLKDSLALLILPVQASCPSCRKKTIDSIIKHQNSLLPNHYIIITANSGRKTIGSYFQEEGVPLPTIEGKLILDSTNQAYKLDLYDKKPTMYYTSNQKVYKRVSSIPETVRQDLQEFFSGYRNLNE